MGNDVSPQQRIEDMIRITELCIDLLKENEEHHGEVCQILNVFSIVQNTVSLSLPILTILLSNFLIFQQLRGVSRRTRCFIVIELLTQCTCSVYLQAHLAL